MLFLLAAGAIAAFASSPREVEPLLIVGLVIGYAAVSRVRFEYSDAYASAEQLVFIPMLVLLPLEYVPLLVCAAGVLSGMPEILAGTWHRQRVIPIVSESWFSVGPVLLLLALAPAPGSIADWELYAAAFVAEVVFDIGGSLVRESLRTRTPFAEFVQSSFGTVQIDAILTPVAFVIALEGMNNAADTPRDRPAGLALEGVLPRASRASLRDPGAQPRVPRHRDAARRRRRV